MGVGLLGIPGPALFAALVVGLAYSLRSSVRLGVPGPASTAAQAVTGVALGTALDPSILSELAESWLPVLGVGVATLALTLGAGLLLARISSADRPTAALGMIAGGASGIVAMSDELGADDRLVAVMQYLRVLVIVLLTPLFVRVVFPDAQGSAAGGEVLAAGGGGSPVAGLALAAGASVAGVALARLGRVPAGTLLGPMVLAGALTLTGATAGTDVPRALQELAFALIGLEVGLKFTPASVRAAGRLLAPVLALIAGQILACAALAAALAPLAGVDYLSAYLATTPGGLYAVLATAFASGANTTFVLAVQTLRLFVMLLAAPPLVRVLAR